MNAMADAMKRAGLVSEEDTKRAAKDAEREAEVERIIHEAALRFDSAMSGLPSGLAREMADWMEANKLIPIEVLEAWALINKREGVKGVRREWAKWLGAWREAHQARADN
jgi:hypothetical protein